MSNDLKISINIPTDDDGMIGRECLKCKKYFKLKLGTGLPTQHCHCPYCDYEGNYDTFWTPAQIEYAKSIAINQAYKQILKPALDKLHRSFKDLERNTRNGFIQFKVTSTNQNFSVPIKYYSEKELETNLICDNCGLEFSIYGVFANCPDCNEINAFLIYQKSIEVTKKQFDIFCKPDIPKEIKENSLNYILTSCVSAFDGLGKELRKHKPEFYPNKPKNLFQNLYALNEILNDFIKSNHSDFDFLSKMFQVRHLFEHNMGVIDNDFVKKIPAYSRMTDRKYVLSEDEVRKFIDLMLELGDLIKDNYKN